ncbi:MAG: DUF3352 domain-containing protein [Proteobacteria bacterium]|nr:DUF3352 domain-containing protein [Pseudomonadota bacterium]MBU1056843.1 DUF3352 domain-containing protein [Pseudomonadota bacterium]
MKKVGVGIFFFFCCFALVVLLLSKQEEKVVAAEFLPENVLFYGEQHDFSLMYQKFQASPLGKTLARLNYGEIAVELGSSAEKVQEMETWRLKISTILDSSTVNELLGKEFSVALFPTDSWSVADPTRSLEERLLLIARPRHNAHLFNFLASFFTNKIQQTTVQYGSHSISRYRVDDKRIVSAVTVKGVIVAGFDERLLRRSLDCYDERKGTLQQNSAFQRLRKSLKQAKLFTYVSLPALYEEGRIVSERLSDGDRQAFLALLDQWRGWGAAACGAWEEEGLVQSKALILYDIQELDPRVAAFIAVKPSSNTTLTMVPADVLFYSWVNTLNLSFVWEMYSSWMVDQPGDLNVLRQEVRDSTGVEIEDLLTMVGKEFAVLVKDVDSSGVPLPKAALVIKLKEPKAFLAVFEKLLAAAEIPVRKEKYKNESISYWGLAPQGGLQPAFSIQKEYLLLSNSIDVIKQIVTKQTKPKKNFFENPDMALVGKGLLLKNNAALYIDIASLADVLKDLASWAGAIATLQGPEVARTSQVVVEQIVQPVLDGVAMYSKLGSRIIIGKDTIMMEATASVVQ